VKCIQCGKPAKDSEVSGKLCRVCYEQTPKHKRQVNEKTKEWRANPENKQKQKERLEKYYQRPEVKQRMKEYNKEYYQRPEVKQRQREYQKTHLTHPTTTFFEMWNRNKSWKQTGIEEMSETYATITCGLTGKESCDLQEKILIKYPKHKPEEPREEKQ